MQHNNLSCRRPKISVVIPTYNSASTIGETIRACMDQDYPNDRLEVIVVDDGSTDETGCVVEKRPVRYIHQDNRGPAAARNRGWRAAGGEAVFFTDADCMPAKDCLSRACDALYERGVAAVAGTYGILNEKDILSRALHEEISFRHSRMPDYINSFGTYNVLIKKDVLKEMSGFDESYLTSSAEDSDLSYRLVGRSYRIYFEKKSIVFHVHARSLYKYFKRQFTRGFWAMRLFRRHPGFVLKDYYVHWKDFMEVPLAAIILFSLFFIWLGLFQVSAGASLLIYMFVQGIIPLKIYFKRPDIRIFIMLFGIMFIRGFVRVSGGALGLVM